MRTHVTIIAWLNILLSLPYLLLGVFLLGTFMLTGAIALPALPLLGGIGIFLFLLIGVWAIPGLILGWGLLSLAPWARMVGIVVSILNILMSWGNFGIGAVLGVYSLVILFNPETERLFR